MAKETMTHEERVWAAIKLEKPDRVPIDILATTAFTKAVGGTAAEVFFNKDKYWAAIDKVWDYTGGWDMDLASIPAPMSPADWKLASIVTMGVKMKIPGVDLPEDYTSQVVEEELLKPEDYDKIAEIGWQRFMFEDYARRILGIAPEGVAKMLGEQASHFLEALARWSERGVVTLYPATTCPLHPFFRFSMARSMAKFIEDLYYHPAPVEKALKVVTREAIEQLIAGSKMLNTKLAFVAEERAEGFFFPLPMFERFWWPYTMEIVDALWSEGIVTWFHLDQCWDKNIPYFKKLPRGSAVLALDGTTDIFAAKKILRNHLCLAGDVQAALMCLGKPKDVEDYCKKLIDEVGGDGGFILSTGCEMPTAVKLDNWRALIQTGRNYELSKKR
jgi:uroporphyrinogen-III decarboxylase